MDKRQRSHMFSITSERVFGKEKREEWATNRDIMETYDPGLHENNFNRLIKLKIGKYYL